jgi:hypothetical protein
MLNAESRTQTAFFYIHRSSFIVPRCLLGSLPLALSSSAAILAASRLEACSTGERGPSAQSAGKIPERRKVMHTNRVTGGFVTALVMACSLVEEHVGGGSGGLRLRCATLRPNGNGNNSE